MTSRSFRTSRRVRAVRASRTRSGRRVFGAQALASRVRTDVARRRAVSRGLTIATLRLGTPLLIAEALEHVCRNHVAATEMRFEMFEHR